MAKTKTSLSYLCCFGSVHHKTPKDHPTLTSSKHTTKQKSNSTSWFPWQRINNNNSMAKTVPLQGSEFDEIDKLKLKFKAKVYKLHSSKWKSNSKSNSLKKTQSNSTPTTSQSKACPTNIVAARRQVRRLVSSKHSETTSKNAERVHNAVVAVSVIVITLVSMMVWGRLCSILCTSASFYLIPCFTVKPRDDKRNGVSDSNDVISDSKKKALRRCSTSL